MRAELCVFRVEEGLGNACASIFPDGSGAVIDWSTCREQPLEDLAGLLNRVREPRLRFVAATHPHADHTLGLELLLSRLHERGVRIVLHVFRGRVLRGLCAKGKCFGGPSTCGPGNGRQWRLIATQLPFFLLIERGISRGLYGWQNGRNTHARGIFGLI